MISKQEIISEIKLILEKKINEAKSFYDSISEGIKSDSKSTAGDKHETSRAMAQIELEQSGKNLLELEKLDIQFKKINFENSNQIKVGSLVEVNNIKYLIAIPLNNIKIKNETIYCIGIQSPFAKLLLGKKINEQFHFNNNQFKINMIS